MEMILVLHNIRSTYNVGAILRTAEGFGVEKVMLSGWTPATKYTVSARTLPHVFEKTTTQIAKTALGTEKMVPCEWSDDIVETLGRLRKEGYVVFGLENNLERDNFSKLKDWKMALSYIHDDNEPNEPRQTLRKRPKSLNNENEAPKVALILGEEVEGIGDSLFPMIDWFLEIPMMGRKESFNVSVAAGIAMYELLGRD